MTSGRLPLRLLTLLAIIAVLGHARAAPLDGETCTKLESEQQQLEHAGIEKEMAKGPAWGKANLAPEKLGQIRRFIELEEQLLFRCRNKALVHLPPEPEPPATDNKAEEDKEQDKGAAAPKAGTPPSAAPPVKGTAPAPKKAAAPSAGKPPAEPKKQDAPATKKPPAKAAPQSGETTVEKRAPKAKADDAFKAPPADPAVNPFAGQLKLPAKE